MSLKSTLNQIIKDRRGEVVPINEIYAYCDKNFYKRSNAERVLRPSQSPNLERIFKNGAIVGYRYSEPKPMPPVEEITDKSGQVVQQYLLNF